MKTCLALCVVVALCSCNESTKNRSTHFSSQPKDNLEDSVMPPPVQTSPFMIISDSVHLLEVPDTLHHYLDNYFRTLDETIEQETKYTALFIETDFVTYESYYHSTWLFDSLCQPLYYKLTSGGDGDETVYLFHFSDGIMVAGAIEDESEKTQYLRITNDIFGLQTTLQDGTFVSSRYVSRHEFNGIIDFAPGDFETLSSRIIEIQNVALIEGDVVTITKSEPIYEGVDDTKTETYRLSRRIYEYIRSL